MKKTYIRPFTEEVRLNISDVLTNDITWTGTSDHKGAGDSDSKGETWNADDDIWKLHVNNAWDK